jgi:hypothetical protein
LVPVVHASGGYVFHGPPSPRSNHYLRWALVEAANLAAARRKSIRSGILAASGRIGLVDFEETTTLSRAAAGCAAKSSSENGQARSVSLARRWVVFVVAKPVAKKLLLLDSE